MSSNDSWWSWGSSILNTVKEKSQNIYEVYKHDLTEFTSTVATDASKVITENAQQLEKTNITETLTSGLSAISEGLTGSLTSLTSLASQFTAGGTEESELIKQINQLQKDPQTFNKKPEDSKFAVWAASFNMDSKKDEIQYNLASNVDLMQMYSELVPNVITSKEFWERYYFRLQIVKEEEEKRATILARAKNLPDVDLKWDDFDDDTGSTQKKSALQELLAEEKNVTPADSHSTTTTTTTSTTTITTTTTTTVTSGTMATPVNYNEPQEQENEKAQTLREELQSVSEQPELQPASSTQIIQEQNPKPQKTGKRIGVDGKEVEDDDWLNWG